MVQAVQVDERSDQWTGGNPSFRVILFERGGDVVWTVDTWEVSECGALDAIRWAQAHVAPGGAWAIGLLDTVTVPGTDEVKRGFTFLEGADLNSQPSDLDVWEAAQVEDMLARLDAPVVPPRASPTVEPRARSVSDESPDP